MNDDALKKLWQDQKFEAQAHIPTAEQLKLMKDKMKKFGKTIDHRDIRELIACGAVFICFGIFLIFFPAPLARAGSVIVMVSSVFVSLILVGSKRLIPKEDPNGPVLDSFRLELRKVEVQIHLLRSILWWYLLPFAFGAYLFFCGVNESTPDRIFYLLAVVFMDVVLYWANRRAVAKTLLPLKNELESLLESHKS